MNHTSFLVKIIETPEEIFFQDNIFVTKIVGKFVPLRKKTFNTPDILQISIWRKLSSKKINFYNANDYIIVEGYISISAHSKTPDFSTKQREEQIEICVVKMYPFRLN